MSIAEQPATEAGVSGGEMERRLSAWMRKTDDSWDYGWSHLVEDRGRLYRHKTFYTVHEYLDWVREHPELDRG